LYIRCNENKIDTYLKFGERKVLVQSRAAIERDIVTNKSN